jgi:hypothetical protein
MADLLIEKTITGKLNHSITQSSNLVPKGAKVNN